MKILPPLNVLRECFSYCQSTGSFSWRYRPRKHFNSDRAHKQFNVKFAGKPAFTCKSKRGYLSGSVTPYGRLLAHRVAWKLVYGCDPKQIDHINGCRVDNRIENLRSVSRWQNAKNHKLRRTNKSGTYGVGYRKDRKCWRARIDVDGKTVSLGSFSTKKEAVEARKVAEKNFGFHPNHGRAA